MEKSDGSPPKALFAQKASSYATPQLYPQFSPTIFNLPTQYVVSVFLPYFLKIGYFFHRNLLQISIIFRNFASHFRRVDWPTAEEWRSLGICLI